MLLIFAIPAALTYTFGRMARRPAAGLGALRRDGRRCFVVGVVDGRTGPSRGQSGVAHGSASIRPAATWRARRSASAIADSRAVRHGRPPTPRAARSTRCTTASRRSAAWCRCVNIQLGEIVFGGVGAGLYGMLVFVLLAVFIAGLMVGRTPEYLGKKIEAREMKLAMLYVLIFPLSSCVVSALVGGRCRRARRRSNNAGPHGLSRNPLRLLERARATTARPSPGSTPTRHCTTSRSASTMLIGRFLMIVPVLAIAGRWSRKKTCPPGPGTFPTTAARSSVLLVGVILIVGALTFFPALASAPSSSTSSAAAGKVF